MRVPISKSKLEVYNRIEISKHALRDNAEFFCSKSGMQIIPVLKSNAYGHGLELVAKALHGLDFPFLAVDGYFEAQRLRKVTKAPILVMGMIKPENISRIKIKNTIFVVHDKATISGFGALNRAVKLHLEINTGMNRYGIDPKELDIYLSLLRRYPKLELDGVMTHLADPDGRTDGNIKEAIEIFDKTVNHIYKSGFEPRFIHAGQSASSMRIKSKYTNSTRIGLSLYGINPFAPGHDLYEEYKTGLKPALKFISTITKINNLKAGERIGYNYTFTAKKPMQVGVLPLGYYEGVDWNLSNKGVVKYRKKFLPIVGKVCMNHTMVDLKGTDIKVGDEIVVYSDKFEDENSFNSISELHGLFDYSLLVKLSPDVRRVLV